MFRPPDRCFLVLHALRLKGVAEASAVALATRLEADEVDRVVAELAAHGLIERRQGGLSGWAPTVLGRKHHDLELAEELEAAGGRAAVESAYREFLELNPELLAACTAWQLRLEGSNGDNAGSDASVANDHTDPGYDAEVVVRLANVHRRARPVLGILAGVLPRFAPYRHRLAHALAQVQTGEGDWFTRPVLDSYHSVWFELHQDLLDTLGLERGA